MDCSHRSRGGLLGIFRQIFCCLAQKYCPPAPPSPPRPQKDRSVYFAPGQISVLVEHASPLSDLQIAELTMATTFLQDRRLGTSVFIPPERVVTFQRGPQDFFSVVFVEAPALYNNAVALLRIVISFNRILQRQDGDTPIPIQRPAGDARGEAQADASTTLDAAPPAALIVRRFSPNWTAGGSSQGIGGGGPGARPVPPATPISVAPATPSPWDITIKNIGLAQPAEQWGAGVEVAILDTMLAQSSIDAAYAKWNMTTPTLAPNPLIDRLFRPGGPLRLSPGGYAHLFNLASFHIADAPYVMVDHGTFIAGIIHTIAPAATIHLIEVLNPLGVGTLETIVRGFKRLVDDRSQDGVIANTPPLVVNASLVLCIPSPTQLAALNAAVQDQATQDQAAQELALAGIDAAALESTNAALQAICDMLNQHQVYFVAAAGNDNSTTLPNRPEADFPAALNNVLGVGALDTAGQPTDYTNVSDRPQELGLATFGGTRAANGVDTSNVDGVLGIYTSNFPDLPLGTPGSPAPNVQGWALWAGTSFAAPIISGGIAAVLSDSLAKGAPLPAQPDQTLRSINPTSASTIGQGIEVQQG